jgi:hypothetical protein
MLRTQILISKEQNELLISRAHSIRKKQTQLRLMKGRCGVFPAAEIRVQGLLGCDAVGSSKFLCNVGIVPQHYTGSQLRRL